MGNATAEDRGGKGGSQRREKTMIAADSIYRGLLVKSTIHECSPQREESIHQRLSDGSPIPGCCYVWGGPGAPEWS
ncbi:hypothetical protein Ddc_15380 [Ditylenchus destructor]|nr:hypothetical protein Ddc_15380 [Ditylenchus destructor]